jgi:hypothetical protein
MADNKKISDLNSLPVAADTDIFPIVDVSVWETKRITLLQLMGSPGPIGLAFASPADFSILTLNGGNPIDEISIDGTLSGVDDTSVPTSLAVKTYVDTAVANAVTLNIFNISTDSTASIGDVLIVDSGSGDVNVELLSTGQIGKITIYKNSGDGNDIIMTPSSGTIDGQPSDTFSFPNSSKEYVTDGSNFYTI